MFKLKKLLVSTAVAALIGAFSGIALAQSPYVTAGTVSVGTALNVRQSYSTSAAVLGKLYSGSSVTVLDSYSGFYKILYNGNYGWVSSQYIKNVKTGGITNAAAKTAVLTAESVLGTPYVYGGASASGFDCSGLVQYAYAKAGVSLPHSSTQQALKGSYVAKSNLQPGDLVFFDTDGGLNAINHDGIYIGNGLFVNAQSGLGRVAIANLSNSYWSGVFMTARRIAG